ncbi:MAG: ribosome biogenesis factor YjgA [Halothiobacillus sp.]|jgi:ribosome-associated protein|nr:ribosome biogenesis factor YjgA [Halothiobacillus sp.]
MSDRRFYAAKKALEQNAHQQDVPEDADFEPSKTERKREAHAARDLGAELCALSDAQLAAFPLSDSLLAAIGESRNIHAHGARKRHLQYIGKLMRQHDVVAIEAELNRIDPDAPQNIRLQHESERWRERLLSDDAAAVTDFISSHPQVDIQALRQLLRQVAKERAEQKPPRYFRELFRLVRDTLSQTEEQASEHGA